MTNCPFYHSNDKSPIIQNRYFRHFKGGLYKLLYEATDSETRESVIVYQALYCEHGIWVRPAKMFFENVSRNGYEGPRFQEISEEEANSQFS